MVILVFGSLATYSTYVFVKKNLLEREKSILKNLVKYQSRELGKIFEVGFFAAETVSNDKEVINFLESDQVKEDEILEQLEHYMAGSIFSVIFIMDKNGLTRASTDTSFIGKNYNFRPYFKESIKGNSAIYSAVGVTSGQLGYYFAYPIKKEQGEIIGVTVAKMDPVYLHESLSEKKNEEVFQRLVLVDDSGIVLYSDREEDLYSSLGRLDEGTKKSVQEERRFENIEIRELNYQSIQDSLQKINNSQIFELSDKDNQGEIVAISSISDYPYFLLVKEEISEINQSVSRVAYLIAGFVVMAAFSATVLLWVVISRSLRPLYSFQKASVKVGKGDYDVSLNENSSSEFRELSMAFNKMARNIRKSHRETEEKIRERTKDLEKMNKLMIGREMKMVEFKKRIQELEEKNENTK
jgi:C4-dicarboxylate-specific signal transduction histidine kinase